jgi:glyoxylase-like metal-dependent hydrolase (beta-lactamase superfamily II)
VRVREVATGLWWWTALHPAWTPAHGGPDGWDQEVGCVYYEAPEAVVLIDPLVPMEDRDRFFRALDRDVEKAGKPVRVLVSVEDHRRSSGELAERYDGTVGELPEGVEVPVAPFGEQVFWIPEHAALVVGDLLVVRADGLQLPRTWFTGSTWETALESLRPLLNLPVERVFAGHGQPVLDGARDALAAAFSL